MLGSGSFAEDLTIIGEILFLSIKNLALFILQNKLYKFTAAHSNTHHIYIFVSWLREKRNQIKGETVHT